MKLFVLFLVYFFVDVKGQRIAGGTDVHISEYPFAASLLTNSGEANAAFSHACGGTIITANAILSAASCFVGTNGVVNQASWWRARVGSSSSVSGGTVYLINLITNHPNFQLNTRVNDIAVIRTTIGIALTPGAVEVARIAGAAYTFNVNQPLSAIGWGAPSRNTPEPTEQLRRVQIWSINQQTCTNRYNALNFAVTDNMVCVGWLDVGIRGQCPIVKRVLNSAVTHTTLQQQSSTYVSLLHGASSGGDAGSPLLDASNAVVGVFSWAEGCADPWYPDINTRVAPYSSWIVATALA